MSKRPVLVLSLLLLLSSAALSAVESRLPESDGPWVVRAAFLEREQVNALAARFEPWEVNYDEGYLLVDVDEGGYRFLLDLGFVVTVDERLTTRLHELNQPLPNQMAGIPAYPCYRTIEETYAAAVAIVAGHPALATLIDIGDSWEKTAGLGGHDMFVLRLTNSAVAGPKPKLFAMASIHAREYTTAELLLRFAEHLIDGYDTDPDITWILDHHEIHILLYTNPDGRKKAETGLSWRKNTNQSYCSPTSNSRGADLNRNFSFKWGCCGGSSGSPCDTTYRGSAAASEPETTTVQSYVLSQFPDQRGPADTDPAPDTATGVFLDIHSYSELVLWPWGWTSSSAPNSSGLRTLGRKLAFFNDYTPEQATSLYVTDGSSKDFAYGELGVAAYTIELGTAFFQDCGTFENTIYPDNLQTLLYAAKVVRTPYLTPSGPEALQVLITPAGALQGDTVELTATVDDTRFNSSNGSELTQAIVAASYYLDDPPWVNPAGAVAMSAADGAFSSTVEDVIATIDTSGLSTGRHIVYVQGEDAAGSLGPVGAAFLHVLDPATAPTIEGNVTQAVSGVPLEATVAVGPFTTGSDAVTGHYSLRLPEGTHEVSAVAVGHGRSRVSGVPALPSQTTLLDLQLYPLCALFRDDVENGNQGWTADSPWAISTEAAHTGSRAWSDSPGGAYGNNRNVSLRSPSWDFTGVTGVRLSFWHIFDLEDDYDYGYVEYSIDGGGTWAKAANYNGENQTTWTQVQLELPALDGQAQAAVRFRLDTDVYITADGWHIDDIEISGAGADCPGVTCGLASPLLSTLPFLSSGDTSTQLDGFRPASCNGSPIPLGAGVGPDLAYWIRVDSTCSLNISMDPVSADLGLAVISPDCSDIEAGCLQLAEANPAGQPETLTLLAIAGVDYYVIVDGNSGDAGAFDLSITGIGCNLVPVGLQQFTIE